MRNVHWAIVIIILLAFGLRFYKVTEIPPSLNWDEVSIGYNAYSILNTGKDEWGEAFPLHFRSYGEYKLPVHVYASIPGIWLFGLNELGVRITPVIYGTLTVLIAFLIGRLMFGYWVGVTSAFLLAISPWHLQLTRASFEASFAAFWISLAVFCFLKSLKQKWYLLLSVVFFMVSVYTYNSARVFAPLFLFCLIGFYRKEVFKNLKVVLLAIGLLVILVLPLVPFILSGDVKARYKLVSITDDPGLIPRINENRGNSRLPQPLPRLIHNKPVYIAREFASNYLSHFTPQFLFISGAPHKHHHVQGMGELYAFEAPFLLLGLFYLFNRKNKYRWIIASWILIAFIPVSTTRDSIPHALRTVIALPSYQLLSGFGFVTFLVEMLSNKKRIWFLGFVGIIVYLLFGYYLYRYYVIYPVKYSRDWQYGYKQVVNYIEDNYQKYDQIVFSRHFGEPHMFTLFYLNYDPAKYQKDPGLVRYETYDWVWVLKFDKFYFPDLGDKGTQFEDLRKTQKGKVLYIGKIGDFGDYPKLKTINFLNNQPAFEIVEVQ